MRDHECKFSSGAKCVYAAMILWFVAACFTLVNHDRTEGAQNAVDIEETDNNDATEPLIQDIIFECEQSTYSRDGDDGE